MTMYERFSGGSGEIVWLLDEWKLDWPLDDVDVLWLHDWDVLLLSDSIALAAVRFIPLLVQDTVDCMMAYEQTEETGAYWKAILSRLLCFSSFTTKS